MDDPPPKPTTTLREALVQPLWTETEDYRSRRRCRQAFALPTAGLAGVVWGVFSASELGIDPAFLWTILSALTFVLFLYVEERVRPAAYELGRRRGLGSLGGLFWDLVVVGGGGFFLIDVLGAPVVPAVATAVVLGGGYAWLMERVFCAPAGEGMGGILNPVRRPPVRPRNDHSLGEALTARGEVDAAMDYYRRAREEDPGDPVPYLRIAGFLAEAGDRAGAREVLKEALREGRLDDRERRYVRRRIREWTAPPPSEPSGTDGL